MEGMTKYYYKFAGMTRGEIGRKNTNKSKKCGVYADLREKSW